MTERKTNIQKFSSEGLDTQSLVKGDKIIINFLPDMDGAKPRYNQAISAGVVGKKGESPLFKIYQGPKEITGRKAFIPGVMATDEGTSLVKGRVIPDHKVEFAVVKGGCRLALPDDINEVLEDEKVWQGTALKRFMQKFPSPLGTFLKKLYLRKILTPETIRYVTPQVSNIEVLLKGKPRFKR